MKRSIYITAFAAFVIAGQVFAAENYSFTQATPVTLPQQNPVAPANSQVFADFSQSQMFANKGTLKGSVVTVPAGQDFRAMVTTPLSSATMFRGQEVAIALSTDFYYNGQLIAPAGSTISGMVLDATKAKHGSVNGRLSIRFNNIITPTGMQIPISAIIRTNDNSGVLMGGTAMDVTKDYAKDITVGAGAGAITGVVMSAMGGGKIGKTAALGTAVGAGGGLVKSIWDKGNDVEIPANSTIDIVLTQPITVVPSGN